MYFKILVMDSSILLLLSCFTYIQIFFNSKLTKVSKRFKELLFYLFMCSHFIFYCLNPVQFSILAHNVFNNVNVILAFSNKVNAILAFSNNVNVILAFLQ